MSFWKGKLLRAGMVIGFFSLLSDLAALLRDRILAAQFGASRSLDIYYSAFKIPDLIFNLFILGAVSSAFIPVFIEHYRVDQSKAWRLSQNFLSTALSGVVIASIVLFLLMPWLAPVLAPGFNSGEVHQLVVLMRLMLLSPVIFAVSQVMSSILQSLQRFTAYAIAPILYNFGIIAGALWIVPRVQAAGYPGIYGLAIGVIVGALLHFAVQLPAVLSAGFRFKFFIDWTDQGLRKVWRLMVPRTLGIGAYSIEGAITNAIASTLGAGSIAVFNFANNLQFGPIAVVGISTATALFPQLSGHASANEKHLFRSKLMGALKNTAGLVILLAVGIAVFRELIIRLLFKVGAFTAHDVHLTASVLGIFMIGVVGQSLTPILSRAFYALQNTRVPVIISVCSIILQITLAVFFTYGLGWGIRGLALAMAIAGNFNALLLYGALRKHI